MRKYLPLIVLLGILISSTMNSFAQNSDPRMWSYHFPKDGIFYDVPAGNLDYKNPNKSPMIYNFRDQVVEVLPNFRVHPSNFSQSEVPITRGLDPNILFASANTYYSSTSFFSEGVYVSTDGGNSWFGSDSCKAAPISDHGGDPGPGVGPDGRLYMSYLPGSYASIKAAYSTDFGNTWSTGAVLQSGSQDKNHTAVDNSTGSPFLGNAYVTWSDFTQSNPSATVSYTTNGGVNWSTYQHINTVASGHYSQGVNGAVGPDGTVYVTWQNPVAASPYTGDFVGLGKSTNGGVTWTYNNNIYDCNGIRGYLDFPGGNSIRVNDFPWMAIDNTGGARNGYMYIVTAEKNLAPAGSDADVVMHISMDGGVTWSSGIRVNQDAPNNGQYQYMPAVCVGEDGAVNVIYYDTRNATISGGIPDSAQVYVSRSTDGGTTFEDFLVSDHSFRPKPISGLAGGYQGDYIGIVESNGVVYPYWCDDISGIYQAWTTQVVFEPPCSVVQASNPTPSSGTNDVSINLSELNWSNGAGANTNELYFGTSPISLTLVQSGSLDSTWTITAGYLPLDYYTTYYWKVVEIGDSCNSSATFQFKTIQDPNFHMVTDTLYPQSFDYWTGTANSTTKTDISLVRTVTPELGWMAFDISSIPDSATITSVSFNGYVNLTNWPYWSITPMGSVNPITDAAANIFNQVSNNADQGIAYVYSNESSSFTTGWHTYSLESGAVPDLQTAVASTTQDWFALGIYDRDNSTTYYINFDGWNQANKPYIVVDYTYITPVELTSFTASANGNSVNLSWNTATELNNSGFEVQRKLVDAEYQKVGYVAGFGTTTEPKSYSFVEKDLAAGNYIYRLKQVDFDGSFEYSSEINVEIGAPNTYTLDQNYPNPFNPSTLIKYSVAQDGFVNVSVFNLIGEKVATLVNGNVKAGSYEVNFNASSFSSGVYFYSIEAGDFKAVRKMMLMK
ncbi:MAG: T9SS type A sorting domain-containing protein [Ignavibacteriales bacterium]|nr:T9SS type A sorting domain-containing protein [Ignavibacteriales bacterium]